MRAPTILVTDFPFVRAGRESDVHDVATQVPTPDETNSFRSACKKKMFDRVKKMADTIGRQGF
jgi:hypothetical protein